MHAQPSRPEPALLVGVRLMERTFASPALIGLLIAATHVLDAAPAAPHSFICAGQGVVCRVSAEGKIVWQMRAGGACYDVWQLPNGNVSFTFKRGAKVVSPDRKVVWQFDDKTSKQFRTIASAQLLDVEETPVSGGPLR